MKKLSLLGRLNVWCDTLAKGALQSTLSNPAQSLYQRLPFKETCMTVEGGKQISDIGKDVRYHIGKARVKKIYARNGTRSATTSLA